MHTHAQENICTNAQANIGTYAHMQTHPGVRGIKTCKPTFVLEESTLVLEEESTLVFEEESTRFDRQAQGTHLNGCHRSQSARFRRGRGGAGRPLSRRSCRTRIWSRFPLSRSASLQACQHPSHCLCVDRWRPDKTRRKERKGETRRNSSDGEAIHLAPGVCRWQVMSA